MFLFISEFPTNFFYNFTVSLVSISLSLYIWINWLIFNNFTSYDFFKWHTHTKLINFQSRCYVYETSEKWLKHFRTRSSQEYLRVLPHMIERNVVITQKERLPQHTKIIVNLKNVKLFIYLNYLLPRRFLCK